MRGEIQMKETMKEVVKGMEQAVNRFIKEEDGMGTVEMALIIMVLIALVVTFRETVLKFEEDVTRNFKKKASKIKRVE